MKYLIYICILMLSVTISAQTHCRHFTVHNIYATPDSLYFDGAMAGDNRVPFAVDMIDGLVVSVNVSHDKGTRVPDSFTHTLDSLSQTSGLQPQPVVVSVRRESLSEVTTFPYYKVDNSWFLADQYDIVYKDFTAKANKSVATSVEHSVLSSGKWAKVRVSESGMKMLTRSALANMGFNNPDAVSVYGNGGSPLPIDNSSTRQSDLAKLPVIRTSNGILFYAEGVTSWKYNSSYSRFNGSVHPSDLYSYYYITDGQSASEAPSLASDYSDEEASTVNSYSARSHHEVNSCNLISSGRDWFGETFSSATQQRTISFSLPPRASESSLIRLSLRIAARSNYTVPYRIYFNDQQVSTGNISAVATTSTTSDYAKAVVKNLSFTSDNTTRNDVTVEFSFSSKTDCGWIDYITVNSDASIDMKGLAELSLRKSSTYSSAGFSRYTVNNAPSAAVVWDVTRPSAPVAIPCQHNGNTLSFTSSNSFGSEYIVFDPNASYEKPTFVSMVNNQDLHSLAPVNYVIVTHDKFIEQAQRLADTHRKYSNLTVAVVTCSQIYNEFSSGKVEPAAIRDFLKMMYDKDTSTSTGLRFALLFGDGSFNNMSTDGSNLIPTYQSAESLNQSSSYVTDDFYGWLDDNEGASDTGSRMDIGIGRFTCQTTDEANALVQKSLNYLTSLDQGRWKCNIAFVADDGDNNEHLNYAEKHASRIESTYPYFNTQRIYLETYTPTNTSTGIVYTGAHNDFMKAINDGSLVINYVGHGGYIALTDDGLFKQQDIKEFTNPKRLPFFITATCSFGPFDRSALSAAEESHTCPNGGFIGLLTTTRLTYGNYSYKINESLFDRLFKSDENGRRYSIGEAVQYAKAMSGNSTNNMKYILLCDPAIVLPINDTKVSTDFVNDEEYQYSTSSIAAIKQNTIKGSIRNNDNSIATDFNGQVSITLYDKKGYTQTNGTKSNVVTIEEYKTTLYSGTAEVTDGIFSTTLILPKDINLEEGYGRISYYAVSNDGREANGSDYQILIGGISDQNLADTVGPTIDAWIDFPEFKDGGTTGAKPILYATITDPSGINTSGLGIGHDISLYTDNNRENAVSLNKYFTYNPGSSSTGTLAYQLSNLDKGHVNITLKAWDNMNNSSTRTININVKPGSTIHFGSVDFYPNPVHNGDNIKLKFSHNDGGNTLTLGVKLYSINGQLIDSQNITIIAAQTQTEEILLAEHMPCFKTLAKGIYIIKVDVTSSSGRQGSFNKKLSVCIK